VLSLNLCPDLWINSDALKILPDLLATAETNNMIQTINFTINCGCNLFRYNVTRSDGQWERLDAALSTHQFRGLSKLRIWLEDCPKGREAALIFEKKMHRARSRGILEVYLNNVEIKVKSPSTSKSLHTNVSPPPRINNTCG